ncbi:MAG: sugar phosphate nucleotidyltransferase [bacterium]
MKGVILAGGTGSRLYPLTKVTNKHLLPVAGKPMIYHPLNKLKQAGIDEILIITGVEHMGDVVNLLGSGKAFGCRFTYKVQDEAGGIAQALGLAEHFAGGEKILAVLGDNIFEEDLSDFASKFNEQASGAKLILKEVKDPSRFGVAEVSGGKIIGIEEKPKQPKSKLIVTGIYMYDPSVFEIVKKLKPSARGELEITDVNNEYIKRGEIAYEIMQGWWTDAGTFETLELATLLIEGCAVK